jgi:multidrug efflux pump
MCAKLLRHKADSQRGRFYEASERAFQRVIDFYGRTLQWVLQRQTATLFVALGTLILTIVLYILIPKGFFPVQDTGIIQGISEAPQSISFDAMSQRQQELARVLEGSGGESLRLHRRRRHQYDA